MTKIAVSCAIGLLAGLALVGAYLGAPYAGLHPNPTLMIVVAAALAFGSSTAVFAQTALGKPAPKPKGAELLGKKLRELDQSILTQFPADGSGAVKLVIKPDTRIDLLDVVKNPSGYAESKILVAFKQGPAKGGAIFGQAPNGFNPISIKQLFMALKDKQNFLHVLLLNEHDEYIGYIPGTYARTEFAKQDSEALIRRFIIDVLSGTVPTNALREIRGFEESDWISNEDTVATAMKRMAIGLLRGFVILQGSRHRKPIAIIYSEDLVRATTASPT